METNLFNYNLAEIKCTYTSKVKDKDRPKVTSSKDCVDLFRTIWHEGTIEHHESFNIMLLNRANKVLGFSRISEGGMSGTVADPRINFSIALKCHAVSIILCHNHPSGNAQPSAADIQLTKNIAAGGKILEITVLDHIILTSEGFYSFADEGLV